MKSFDWFAGLFEGEGCFCLDKTGHIQLTIVSTDEDVLREVLDTVKVGHITGPYQPYWTGNAKLQWRWSLSRLEDSMELMRRLQPMMGHRRSIKIDELFTYREKLMLELAERHQQRKYVKISKMMLDHFKETGFTKIGDPRGAGPYFRKQLGLSQVDSASIYTAMKYLEEQGLGKRYHDNKAGMRVRFSSFNLTDRGIKQVFGR